MRIVKLLAKLLVKIIIFLAILIAIILVAFNWPVQSKNENMEFGVSFSDVQARALDMDWKSTYIEILTDLKPKKMRIAAYWSDIEKEPGVYDFSNLDFQVEQAEKYGTKLVLAMGVKVPRWPECFIPEMYAEGENDKPLSKKVLREDAVLKFEKALVERYKDREIIEMWQVENEPFLSFGHCIEGALDKQIVEREIAQVHKLDSTRKIMTTDSGELSLWRDAASRADIFGTTMYRIIYKGAKWYDGYVHYPIGPNFFRIKAKLIGKWINSEDIVISELQGEPWGPGWIKTMPIEEQYKSMSPQKLVDIAEFARRTKFKETYVWGVEWWYMLKYQRENSDMIEAAKQVITKREEK
ncbi:hypothetical protein HN784_00735 [bacterium]|jgi:hypothetical protein|nr:hypothetical protein [bacterium]MBT4251602.1 hypothetical protein [bacterium]MBT4597651.1 hypothetical protein [bacterium]MBT6753664.1 hypothetical protein [bacterium]MBT7037801.1 hypothetical protein [bacterium]